MRALRRFKALAVGAQREVCVRTAGAAKKGRVRNRSALYSYNIMCKEMC